MNHDAEMAICMFDSHCVLCEGGVHYILRHEKRPSIRFVAVRSVTGQQLARQHGVDPDDPQTFLFVQNGVAHQKSGAVMALSRHLRGPARVVGLGRWIPKFLRDGAYDFIAKRRYKLFGQKEMCITPTSENRHRFIL